MLLDTPICEFGWKAQPFALKDFHGQSYTLNDVMGNNGLLIAFICNHCPYVQAIIDRLVKDAQNLENKGVNTIAIMPNDYHFVPEDRPEKMKEFALLHQINFSYWVDETQEIAKTYGAVCTPDFFGFNNNFELQYRGRLDNLKMNEAANNHVPELLEAMEQIAKTGQGPKKQHPSMGCSIKWKK